MVSSNLKIATLNVRGISNQQKREVIFHWLYEQKYEIICLQETYCTKGNELAVDKSRKGSAYHCLSDSSHSRGVSILFGEKFKPNIISNYCTNDGRILVINFELHSQTYSLVNIYAPSEQRQRKQFYIQYKKWIKDKILNDNYLFLCGDCNCTLQDIDRRKPNYDIL